MQAKQNKEFIHSFPWLGRCSTTPRRAGPITWNGALGRQNSITPKGPLPLSPLYIPSMMPLVWNIPLDVPFMLCPGCPLDAIGLEYPFAYPFYPLSWLCPLTSHHPQERPWLCVSPAQPQQQHPCVTNLCSAQTQNPGGEMNPRFRGGEGHLAGSTLLTVPWC